jgi:hypothetical protein
MHIISHRGNIAGANPKLENDPEWVLNVIKKAGFDVEVDVWYYDGQYSLGHDKPMYKVDAKFLQNPALWCHAKHLPALNAMLSDKIGIHCFWHQRDAFTVTSQKFIWTYPKMITCDRSILVTNEPVPKNTEIFGVCTDQPYMYLPPPCILIKI